MQSWYNVSKSFFYMSKIKFGKYSYPIFQFLIEDSNYSAQRKKNQAAVISFWSTEVKTFINGQLLGCSTPEIQQGVLWLK